MLLITSTANIKTWERDNGLYGGLSPLARGAQHRKRLRGGGVRFIPAGAGSSTWRIFATPARTVYPRWRGELGIARLIRRRPYGLSPLARGTLFGGAVVPLFFRFIPAGAGNTSTCSANGGSTGGLSPLARGTHFAGSHSQLRNRFIPAGAGNTPRIKVYQCYGPVYPRWRGEHATWRRIMTYKNGLSPLARGTPWPPVHAVMAHRFIPAGAGNTCRVKPLAADLAVYPRWRGEHSKHNLLLINDFLSQSQSTNFIVSHKQHIHYVKEHLIHWLKR